MKIPTHYELLQVTETASAEVIRASWITLQRQYHPDRPFAGLSKDEQTSLCQMVNAAYQVLSDPQRRAEYDATLKAGRRPVEVPFGNVDPTAYPEAYGQQPVELGLGVFEAAMNAAGSVFVSAMLSNLPPELRHLAMKLKNRRAS